MPTPIGNVGNMRVVDKRAAFTLLEFLVAFTMISMFLSAVLAGLWVAMRRDTQASFMSRAVRTAVAKLAATEADIGVGPGVTSGRSIDGLVWKVNVQPYGRISLDGERNVNGYWIEVTVSDPTRSGRNSVDVTGLAIREEARK